MQILEVSENFKKNLGNLIQECNHKLSSTNSLGRIWVKKENEKYAPFAGLHDIDESDDATQLPERLLTNVIGERFELQRASADGASYDARMRYSTRAANLYNESAEQVENYSKKLRHDPAQFLHHLAELDAATAQNNFAIKQIYILTLLSDVITQGDATPNYEQKKALVPAIIEFLRNPPAPLHPPIHSFVQGHSAELQKLFDQTKDLSETTNLSPDAVSAFEAMRQPPADRMVVADLQKSTQIASKHPK